MKNFTKFLTIAILGLAFSATTFGQSSATANASATIVGPISISNTADMNFGNVAVNATPGTVVLAPASTRTATGGVTLPATTGTVSAAAFTVTGAPGYTYSISLPSSVTITNGVNNMTVDTFTSNPTVASGGTLTGGTENLTVGATLNVGASQAAGSYSSAAPFTVTVNYN